MLKDIILPNRAGSQNQKNPGVDHQAAPPNQNQVKISVVLADDHNIVREGLKLLIESAADIEVIGEAENGRQAVEMALQLKPDVVVMDLAMPTLNGLEATKQIVRRSPDAKVLILSSFGDEARVKELVNEGATGYLVKQTAATELLKGIREVRKGNPFFSASISRILLDQMKQNGAYGSSTKKKPNALTSRETEVLQLISEGYANKQIAAELGISIKTVEKHRQQVMNKLNIHDVAGLTRHVVARGFTVPVGNKLAMPLQNGTSSPNRGEAQARPGFETTAGSSSTERSTG